MITARPRWRDRLPPVPSTFGWGAGLSGHFIRVAKDGIYFQANGGYGIGRYATDSGTAPGRFRHLGRRQNAQDRAWSPRGSGRRVSRCLRVDPSGSLLARPTRAEGILRERCRIAQMADRCAKAAIVIAAISSGAHRPRMQRICRRLKRGDTLERRRRFAGRETGRQRDCCRNARASDFHGMFLPSLLSHSKISARRLLFRRTALHRGNVRRRARTGSECAIATR